MPANLRERGTGGGPVFYLYPNRDGKEYKKGIAPGPLYPSDIHWIYFWPLADSIVCLVLIFFKPPNKLS